MPYNFVADRGPVDPKFQTEGVAPPTTILLLRKLR